MPKRLLMTGASGGIGLATAQVLIREGWDLALLCHRHPEALANLSSPQRLQIYQADLNSTSDLLSVLAQAQEDFGGFEALINNAGIAEQKLLSEIDEHDLDLIFSVNFKAAYHTSKTLMPYMIRQQFGRIVNVASVWGLRGASMESHYAASKAALIGFSHSLAKELGPSGITVNAVCPGVIQTEMNKQLSEEDLSCLAEQTPLGRIGEASEVAELIAFLCSEKASFITAQAIAVDGGFAS